MSAFYSQKKEIILYGEKYMVTYTQRILKKLNGESVSGSIRSLGKDTIRTSWELFRITIPIIIITKICEELGFIDILSNFLEPVMNLVGLPGQFGLVWATAMLTNLYGAVVVFATLAPDLHPTAAQATIVCSMMLIAHSLPLELSISKKAGAAFTPIALLRVVGALVYGFLLNVLCKGFAIWQEPAAIIFRAEQQTQTLLQWVVSQVQNLGVIVVIIFCILIIMRLLRILGILSFIERMLEPLLPPFGMSRKAAPITVVGMVMGISYGGALIIRETSSGRLGKREIFFSLVLMGLCHSVIEDTLLMMALGGRLGGILWGRIVFSLVIVFLLARLVKAKNEKSKTV